MLFLGGFHAEKLRGNVCVFKAFLLKTCCHEPRAGLLSGAVLWRTVLQPLRAACGEGEAVKYRSQQT